MKRQRMASLARQQTTAAGKPLISSRKSAASAAAAPAAALLALLAATSCSGRIDATVRNDSSARMSIMLEVPDALAARVRQIGNIPASHGLFNLTQLKDEFAKRKTISLVDVSAPSLQSMTSVIWIPNMQAFIADRSVVPEGMIALSTVPAADGKPARRELSISINRENAAEAFALFPGIDARLVQSLSPPALEKDPITADEYRMNLESVIIGKKTMPAFDACMIELSITAPKTLLSVSGGTMQGQVFKTKLSLFELLTLEKPIRMSFSWAD